MRARLGVAPIAWSNDDLPELGGDTTLETCLRESREAGFSGVRLAEQVDPSILGGLIVRIGSRLYDNSIKSKLQRLQYAMKGAA